MEVTAQETNKDLPFSYAGSFSLNRDEHFIKIRAYHAAIIPDNLQVDKRVFRSWTETDRWETTPGRSFDRTGSESPRKC